MIFEETIKTHLYKTIILQLSVLKFQVLIIFFVHIDNNPKVF